MPIHPDPIQIINEIQYLLTEENSARQKSAQRFAVIQAKVSELSSCDPFHAEIKQTLDMPQLTRISNGHTLTSEESNQITEEDYDLILDFINGQLKYRLDPDNHSQLQISNLKGIGPIRLSYLEDMIRHFQQGISSYGRTRRREGIPTAIRLLREATGTPGTKNPYFLTEPDWSNRDHSRACLYKLNSKYKYLLMKAL